MREESDQSLEKREESKEKKKQRVKGQRDRDSQRAREKIEVSELEGDSENRDLSQKDGAKTKKSELQSTAKAKRSEL